MATVRRLPRADRPVSSGGGVHSRHGLSFGAHYDPERTSFGALVAHNDDVLDAGVAYGAHEHRDVEILAWVLDGTMIHTGPDDVETVAPAGTLQHLVAGTGWHHDERAGPDGPVHLLQLWVTPALDDPPAGEPSLTHHRPDLAAGPFTLGLRRPGVTVTLVRVGAGSRLGLPEGTFRHVHVARGSLDDVPTGDSLEITGPGSWDVDAGPDGAELVVVTTA
ncbi:quercetin 2,3-dioxygenase [Actinomycetospora sp. NBRC 106375]|uniref:pirin family protein n=1 Tax=Actinomycetospora sp. NBRC 106375 TaxID=3032207 RepID=UPI0024A2FF29|nr:pirin family protein [Actinomycetospora sp. NBRC 106375]GLZ49344.1 quercetin 2,3-dioxygenase [Actinomycetospora sp. NBRC 106375]